MVSSEVSVIIPVFNGANFISDAINSVLNQTVKAGEVIVVNDGSSDKTIDVLKSFGNDIKVISIENGGVANARNVGLQASTKNLVAFLDADDVWYFDKLEKQVEVFHRYPNVGFCCTNYDFIGLETKKQTKKFSLFENNPDYNFDKPLSKSAFLLLLHANFVGTCSNVMVKRNLIETAGFFDVSLKQAEDYDMWIKLSLITDFFLMSDSLVEKKRHHTNLTNNFLETYRYHEMVLLNLLKDESAKTLLNRYKKYFNAELAKIRFKVGNLFYDDRNQIMAYKYLLKGLVTSFTFENIKLFFHFFSRKLFRTLTFDLFRTSSQRNINS